MWEGTWYSCGVKLSHSDPGRTLTISRREAQSKTPAWAVYFDSQYFSGRENKIWKTGMSVRHQCFFRVCGQTLVTSSSTHFGHALIGAVLSVSPSIFLHQTISAVDSNLVPHDKKQAATGVEWLRQEKKERLSSTDRSVVFCFMAQIVVGIRGLALHLARKVDDHLGMKAVG